MRIAGKVHLCFLFSAAVAAVALYARTGAGAGDYPTIGPLPEPPAANAELAELGKKLFFDTRLSGDAGISCATCHVPEKGWADAEQLSKAYPGSEYFRNSQSLYNVAFRKYYYWDGRMSADDPQTQVRDSITETHFMNMDGRLMLERLKQVPEYDTAFKKFLGGEPSFGRTLKAIAEFEKTIFSSNVPFDQGKLSADAEKGKELFTGKAGCVRCHNGPMFTDNDTHNTGVPENLRIVKEPLRHITLRSMSKSMGAPGFESLKKDPGFFLVSKRDADFGKFLTPSLRELTHTAPYMHNGMLATLEDVIEFYDRGGGNAANKDPILKPLGLSGDEKKQLAEFLKSLSGDPFIVEAPSLPEYQLIKNWQTTTN